MSLSDSAFLFEIIYEELTRPTKEHCIVIRFADVFQHKLKDPNILGRIKRKCPIQHKSKVSDGKKIENKNKIKYSIVMPNDVGFLISRMKMYPLELSLCSKTYPNNVLGYTQIPWNIAHIDYLSRLDDESSQIPVTIQEKYDVCDEYSSKKIASIKLSTKLSCIKGKCKPAIKHNRKVCKCKAIDSALTKVISTKIDSSTPGNIKTIYKSDNKGYKCTSKFKTYMKAQKDTIIGEENTIHEKQSSKNNAGIIHLVTSEKDLDIKPTLNLRKSRSFETIEYQSHLNTLNYIFGDNRGPFGNKEYYVGYFTVQSANDVSSKEFSSAKSSNQLATESKLKLDLCKCSSENESKCFQSKYSLNLPSDTTDFVNFTKCKNFVCNTHGERQIPAVSDNRILLNFGSMQHDCCDNVTEAVEDVVGGLNARIKIGKEDPCYCSCECTFGFIKKTTYCNICGGYEVAGEDLSKKLVSDLPFPCPIYHKLVDKNKLKTCSSGSDSRKSLKPGVKKVTEQSGESEKENKKSKKIKKDDRFKFNYGYQGIPPKIGHSQCAMPCSGTLGAVPKNMGWLWTAEDIPGLKFRPLWKPGATNKHVARLLRIARYPGEVISKKRKKDTSKKRSLKRPLLIVQKKEGEYTVTMETMKTYSKQRAVNQVPYEDKPVITYTIGRSEEENRERRKRKERAQRRLERSQRHFIQSAFKNMCKEICVKTYQQALGILPGTEEPDCTCYPAEPGPDRTNMDVSCSCSEDSVSIGSDTDSDEWIVEFTPPNAYFDPSQKGKKVVKADNGTQYTYLDYRVKLLDRYGNPVPRFFKGPDGKQQCSDLGGFWSPDHKWLEINVDGYIAPDNRWAPNVFIGPSGEQVDSNIGKFQTTNGKWLSVGVDGYIDILGKWRFYAKQRFPVQQKKIRGVKMQKNNENSPALKPSSVASWSCFGDVSPIELAKMGIVGHGLDRQLLFETLQELQRHGEGVTIPQPSVVPRRPEPRKTKTGHARVDVPAQHRNYGERPKCRHPVPSEKGIVAVNAHGDKTYFKLKTYPNRRPRERLQNLLQQGISLSSFHVPCFHSFLNCEILKQQQKERLEMSIKNRTIST